MIRAERVDPARDVVEPLPALAGYDVFDTALESAFEEITSLMRRVFGMPIAAITLRETPRRTAAATGSEGGFADGHTAFCFDGARPVGPGPVCARFEVPLRMRDGCDIGMLGVSDLRPRDFSDADTALLHHFADLVVTQLELRRIARQDALTGALTRHAFEEAAHREIARHRRTGAPVALAIFDLDHFKAINDTHGHPVGDVVLRRVVGAARASLRDGDLLGRLGGEEFGLILHAANLPDAARAADRIRVEIEAAVFPGQPALRVTASFGIAACAPYPDGAADWIAMADAALYDAKRDGRNRCRLAPDPAEALSGR